MATTYSTSLKLALIGDGDQAGIWGQTTNTNLGTLLEQAITGVQSITMVDANYTLTNFNGVTNEARNAVLVVTGTNNAIRDLIPPVVEKLYTIVNNTAGGYAIRVIGGSGTGVSIPNGATCLVYCDGTNFVNGLSGAAGNFSISGALSVTSTTNLSAALSYGGVTLSNAVTGTGNMVLSASPTFTGAPIAPTAAPGTNTTQIATTAFVTAATGTLGTMSTQNANAVAITGGTLNGVTGTAAGLTVGTATNATNATNATTATNATQFQGKTKLGLGITGEVWNNVTGSRVKGTTYTNSYSYPIQIIISGGKGGDSGGDLYINGNKVAESYVSAANHQWTLTAIIPPSSTYKCDGAFATIITWYELY